MKLHYMIARSYLIPVYFVLLLLGGCSSMGPRSDISGTVPLTKSVVEIPEEQLLDVWIELFDPGELPEDEDDAMGLSMDIRDAEARCIPERLRTTMEQTGHLGAVRLVPRNTTGGELLIRGRIIESDGEQLALHITVHDATGRQWYERVYQQEVDETAYRQGRRTHGAVSEDVFQSLYNTISNDLAAFRSGLTKRDIGKIRQVAELRFAADLSPDAFAGDLQMDESRRYTIAHLPAANDPMYQRVLAIRDRDSLLIDTLNGHFDNFCRDMQEPYSEWRMARSEEAASLRQVKREALQRKLIGVAAILGAVALDASSSNNYGSYLLRDSLVIGGAYAIKTGFDKDSEKDIHRDAIVELGESLSLETRPLVVELEGETHKLTGSAETQYAKWRALLKRIYVSETGFTGS